MRVMFASRMLNHGDGTTLSVGMISVRTADHGEENDKMDIMGVIPEEDRRRLFERGCMLSLEEQREFDDATTSTVYQGKL